MIFDIRVMAEEVETTHRVMVGRDYYGDDPKVAEQMVERTIAILFYKKTPRQTRAKRQCMEDAAPCPPPLPLPPCCPSCVPRCLAPRASQPTRTLIIPLLPSAAQRAR